MHKFTDGCASQYKSRHCIGDLSCSLTDFGFPIQRNYFETTPAKGEQDAAGSHIKQKVSQAVLRKTASITSARSMHDFLVQHFSQPAPSSSSAKTKSVQLKRRIFHFVPSSGEGSELKRIRTLHCMKTTPQQGKVFVQHRSCYCITCIVNDVENCTNKAWLDEWKPGGANQRGWCGNHSIGNWSANFWPWYCFLHSWPGQQGKYSCHSCWRWSCLGLLSPSRHFGWSCRTSQ